MLRRREPRSSLLMPPFIQALCRGTFRHAPRVSAGAKRSLRLQFAGAESPPVSRQRPSEHMMFQSVRVIPNYCGKGDGIRAAVECISDAGKWGICLAGPPTASGRKTGFGKCCLFPADQSTLHARFKTLQCVALIHCPQHI